MQAWRIERASTWTTQSWRGASSTATPSPRRDRRFATGARSTMRPRGSLSGSPMARTSCCSHEHGWALHAGTVEHHLDLPAGPRFGVRLMVREPVTLHPGSSEATGRRLRRGLPAAEASRRHAADRGAALDEIAIRWRGGARGGSKAPARTRYGRLQKKYGWRAVDEKRIAAEKTDCAPHVLLAAAAAAPRSRTARWLMAHSSLAAASADAGGVPSGHSREAR